MKITHKKANDFIKKYNDLPNVIYLFLFLFFL